MQEPLPTFSFSLFKKTKCILRTFRVKKSWVGIKAKLFIIKNWFFWSGVGFLIRCILDHGQRHLVDFWEKFPTDLDFIWIEQISYNSGVLFQIVWSRTSIFKHKSFSTEGCATDSLLVGTFHMMKIKILPTWKLHNQNYSFIRWTDANISPRNV